MISKGPISSDNFKKNIVYTKSARLAWSVVLQALNINDRVLLPSYIGYTEKEGSGIYDPILENKIDHDFYRLNNNLSVNINALEEQLKSNRYKLLLLVNYFGILQEDFKKVRYLTDKYDVILVEDCAHYFNLSFPENNKDKADFAFYSLHKFFPFVDGGTLKINSKKLELNIEEDKKNSLVGSEVFSYDIHRIVDIRRQNFLFLESHLNNNPFIKLFHSLKENDIPHNFPIIVKNNLREKVYFKMQEQGFPLIALYYRLIQPIYDLKDQSMIDLSNSILNLPVHQDTTQKDLEELIICLEKVLLNLNQV